MKHVIEATFDGQVFHPSETIDLEPNTKVQLVVTINQKSQKPASFVEVASSLNTEGPADWSERFDDYLYGGASLDEE